MNFEEAPLYCKICGARIKPTKLGCDQCFSGEPKPRIRPVKVKPDVYGLFDQETPAITFGPPVAKNEKGYEA